VAAIGKQWDWKVGRNVVLEVVGDGRVFRALGEREVIGFPQVEY